jgi:hypothetical protein
MLKEADLCAPFAVGPCVNIFETAPMASQARIDANRQNAKRSTGPKTEAGKARASLNALKDGSHAKTVNPVLPQENALELDQRINQWISDLNPRNDAERELVINAANLSWEIERARRCETARLAERVSKAQHKAAQRTKGGPANEEGCMGKRPEELPFHVNQFLGSRPVWSFDPFLDIEPHSDHNRTMANSILRRHLECRAIGEGVNMSDMSEKLARFLRNLNLDPDLREAFEMDPASIVSDADLSDSERAWLIEGDPERWRAYLPSAQAAVAVAVVVVAAAGTI